jgi:hypothetical protein
MNNSSKKRKNPLNQHSQLWQEVRHVILFSYAVYLCFIMLAVCENLLMLKYRNEDFLEVSTFSIYVLGK